MLTRRSHVNSIKYTCPRCGIHTCSLPCVKRHKTWAQCSGVRDPAAYRKRADLATATSIDQDFNFITSVERSLQRADEVTVTKGIGIVPSGIVRDHGTKLNSEIEERGINLIRAPKGLSRNKQNKTQWARGKGIVWTIEWLCHDGDKRISNISESWKVQDAFLSVFGWRIAKRKKRKRSDAETQAATDAEQENPLSEPDAMKGDGVEKLPQPLDLAGDASRPTDLASSRDMTAINASLDTGSTQVQHRRNAQALQGLHFYLFKPNTTLKVKCLIPIAADAKLIDILRNRTLLEFPTFHVRHEPPETLPAPFVTEEKYNQFYGTDVTLNLPTYTPNDELEEGEVIDLENIDERKVLEVLQKDLNG